MEKNTQDVVLSQTKSELKLPPSPKQPRTDCTVSEGHSGKSRFHFPELQTFQEACVIPSFTILMPKSAELEHTAQCGKDKYQKTEEQLQDISLMVTPMSRITPSHSDEANTESQTSVLLVKDEQPPATETVKLSSSPPDDAGEASEESHTSKDASADSSSEPDCHSLGKSLEDKPPGGCNLHAGNVRDGRQVQNSVSQIQAFNLSSSNEKVKCLSDFTCEGLLCDTDFCHTCGEYAGDEQHSQRSGEDIVLNENEVNSPISSVVLTDSKLFHLITEKDPYGSMKENVKSEAEIIKMQLCENEDFPVWDGKTKAQVNENDTSENPIHSAVEEAEGSIVSYNVVLVRNIGSETTSLEADDFCGAKRAHAASKMIANTGSEMSDHPTETPMPARISQEPAEGDNYAGPLGVIDPAIWSESDGEAVEKRSDSVSAAGAELSTFVKICARDTLVPLCPDAQTPQKDSTSVHSRTHLCKDKKDFCLSFTEPQACLTTTKDTHSDANNEGVKTPPGTNKTPASSDSVGHHSAEQHHLGCFPASLDGLLPQEVEYLLSEFAGMDGTTQIKQGKEMPDMESTEQEKLERSIDLEEILQGMENYCEDTSKMSIDDLLSEWVEEKTLTQKEESENTLERLSDHSYSVFPIVEEATEESQRKEAEDIHLAKLMDREIKRDTTKVSPDEYMSEQSEALKSQSGDKILLNNQQEHSMETCLWFIYGPETAGPSSDAIFPGPHEFRHSQTADQNPTAFIRSGRFSQFRYALSVCNRVSGAFDTFEKIKLLRDNDGDNDASLSNSPWLSSTPKQLLETPQRQLHATPEAESGEREEMPREEAEEEDVGRFECHTDGTANGLSSCDYSCDEISNFISTAADVPAHCWPEPKPDCESAFKSSESFQDELKPLPVSWDVSSENDSPASDVNSEPQFEMRQQFDKVLKELNCFFDVSRSEFACYSGESSPEQCDGGAETWESDASDSKDVLMGCGKDTSSDDADDVQHLDVCGCDPMESFTPGRGDGEQEVPLGSCQEVFMPSAEKRKEPQEMEPKRKTWSPAFMCQPLLEHLSYRPPEPSRRLEPLKTCTRPLRVGLSKRAKTKHLHRPHPYK